MCTASREGKGKEPLSSKASRGKQPCWHPELSPKRLESDFWPIKLSVSAFGLSHQVYSNWSQQQQEKTNMISQHLNPVCFTCRHGHPVSFVKWKYLITCYPYPCMETFTWSWVFLRRCTITENISYSLQKWLPGAHTLRSPARALWNLSQNLIWPLVTCLTWMCEKGNCVVYNPGRVCLQERNEDQG